MGRIYVGTGGFTYADWKDSFYPKGLSPKKELWYASNRLSAVEINATFYRHQSPATYERWYLETPPQFQFAIKGPRSITHDKRLKEPESSLANFFASGVLRLGEKLGPVLWQLPPYLPLKLDRLEHFLSILPRDAVQAAVIAHNHSERMEGRVFLEGRPDTPLRHAFEFRHPSFRCPEVISLLAKYGHALVFAHSPNEPAWYAEDVTSDFIYWRMHGGEERYLEKGYSAKDIGKFAKRAQIWAAGGKPVDAIEIDSAGVVAKHASRDVYVFFDNEAKQYAPFHACDLIAALTDKKKTNAA